MNLELLLIEEQRLWSRYNHTLPARMEGALRHRGFIGGAIRAFSGSPGVSVVGKVKNRALQAQLDSALSDYEGLKQTGQQSLSDYLGKYFSDQPSRDTFTGQETGAISNFYNGNVANTLASLRQSRAAAVNRAADVGVSEALRGVNSNALQGDGGPSSYQDREAMAAVAPIRTQAAVDEANQARADYGYVTQGQLDLTGKRSQLETANDASALVPYQVKSSMYGQNVGYLGNLIQADQANHFYGLKQNPNPWADFADSADQGIMNAASIYSSVAGGMMAHGGLVRVKGYKSGGTVKDGRKDYSGAGGGVSGPGGPTDDKVPAWLSDMEYVMPAAAVKMPGVLPLLEKIRQMALKDSTASSKPRKFGHYDMGGMIGGMGGMGGGDPSIAVNSGIADWSNVSGNPDPTSWQQPQQGQKKSSGGGGGLSGQAMALQARADRDQMTQWFPSSTTFGTEPTQRFVPPTANTGAPQIPYFAQPGVTNV